MSTEREQLARESRGTIGGLADLDHVFAAAVVRRQVFLQQLCVPGDGGEEVVEVVGDPAREPSHGLHLLRLAELLL